jgi:hypothetical protein
MNPNQCPISESRETNTVLVLLEQHTTNAFGCSWFSSLKLLEVMEGSRIISAKFKHPTTELG